MIYYNLIIHFISILLIKMENDYLYRKLNELIKK